MSDLNAPDHERLRWLEDKLSGLAVITLATELEGGVALSLDEPGAETLVLREQNDARTAIDVARTVRVIGSGPKRTFRQLESWLAAHKCATCAGSGTRDDSDFGDISFNTWPCKVCGGTGIKQD